MIALRKGSFHVLICIHHKELERTKDSCHDQTYIRVSTFPHDRNSKYASLKGVLIQYSWDTDEAFCQAVAILLPRTSFEVPGLKAATLALLVQGLAEWRGPTHDVFVYTNSQETSCCLAAKMLRS